MRLGDKRNSRILLELFTGTAEFVTNLVEFHHGNMKTGQERSVKTRLMFVHSDILVRFQIFTAVTMKKGVLWEVTPCS
jgi:hypothetical protein